MAGHGRGLLGLRRVQRRWGPVALLRAAGDGGQVAGGN